jgi:hypothetical protein
MLTPLLEYDFFIQSSRSGLSGALDVELVLYTLLE